MSRAGIQSEPGVATPAQKLPFPAQAQPDLFHALMWEWLDRVAAEV